MITRIIILSFIVCISNIGCVVTIPVLTVLGTGGAIVSKYIDHKLKRESLGIRKGELELKREIFELKKAELQ